MATASIVAVLLLAWLVWRKVCRLIFWVVKIGVFITIAVGCGFGFYSYIARWLP